jgi:hypothetical protein
MTVAGNMVGSFSDRHDTTRDGRKSLGHRSQPGAYHRRMSEPAGVGPERFDDHYLHFRFVVRDGRVRRLHMSVRAPTLPELRAMLLGAGFDAVEAYDEHGEPFTAAARRLVVVARR